MSGALRVRMQIFLPSRYAACTRELHIYRIVQEAMHNILKHSRASSANTVLDYCDHQFECTIKNNGVGYDDRDTYLLTSTKPKLMEQEKQSIKIAIADDHVLFRSGLAGIVNNFDNCSILFEAGNGTELIKYIKAGLQPDLILLDLNMPEMDGFATSKWLQNNQPQIHVLMVTMYDTELTMIRLLQAGVKGFLKKDVTTSELKFAIYNIMQYGYYYTNNTTGKLINLFRKSQEHSAMVKSSLSDLELRFLKFTCTDLTYKEIANEMNLNPRAVDNLRDNLFEKLEVKSRVGLAMYAIRHCIHTF
jgi:two-component system invasion response regulator UvrY